MQEARMALDLADGLWVGKVMRYHSETQTGEMTLTDGRTVRFKLTDFFPVTCQVGDEVRFYIYQGEVKTAQAIQMGSNQVAYQTSPTQTPLTWQERLRARWGDFLAIMLFLFVAAGAILESVITGDYR